MKSHLAMIMAAVVVGSTLAVYAGNDEGAAAGTEKKAPAPQAVYACPDCHTVAMAAGKCKGCDKEMVKSRVLEVKNGEATICGCDSDCKCDAKSVKDGKCSCGKDVGKVSLKGMFVCPEGCPAISDKPGNCQGCGKEMKKVE
jgi:hypothetical protein